MSALLDGDDFDHEAVDRLLTAMKADSKPVGPKLLGTIGEQHLRTRFAAMDIVDGSFEYKKVANLDDDGLPQVTEVAFGAWHRPRVLIAGVNWSACWLDPFRQLGGQGLEAVLTDRRMSAEQPVAVLVHVAHPRVQYADRGKSSVVVGADDILRAVDAVGKKWTRQVKAEEKRSVARRKRVSMFKAPARRSLKSLAYKHMQEAWDHASDDGRLPTHWRQVFYVIRPLVDGHPESDRPLVDKTFKSIIEDTWRSVAPAGTCCAAHVAPSRSRTPAASWR